MPNTRSPLRTIFLPILLPVFLAASCTRASPATAPAQRPPTAEGPARQVEVLVEGTAGTRFEGTLGEPGATRTITGSVPAQFTLQMRQNVYVRLQKAAREGKMVVHVTVDGREVASRSTEKPYGLIAILYPPAR